MEVSSLTMVTYRQENELCLDYAFSSDEVFSCRNGLGFLAFKTPLIGF